jgi:hypothetical protein
LPSAGFSGGFGSAGWFDSRGSTDRAGATLVPAQISRRLHQSARRAGYENRLPPTGKCGAFRLPRRAYIVPAAVIS